MCVCYPRNLPYFWVDKPRHKSVTWHFALTELLGYQRRLSTWGQL